MSFGDRGMPGLPVSLRLAEARGVAVEWLAEGVEDPAGEEEEPAGENPYHVPFPPPRTALRLLPSV